MIFSSISFPDKICRKEDFHLYAPQGVVRMISKAAVSWTTLRQWNSGFEVSTNDLGSRYETFTINLLYWSPSIGICLPSITKPLKTILFRSPVRLHSLLSCSGVCGFVEAIDSFILHYVHVLLASEYQDEKGAQDSSKLKIWVCLSSAPSIPFLRSERRLKSLLCVCWMKNVCFYWCLLNCFGLLVNPLNEHCTVFL